MMKILKKILGVFRNILYLFFIPFFLVVPRFKKKVVFGAWNGDMFSDNPKYLALYLISNKLADCIWIGKSHLRKDVEDAGLKFAEMGSFKAKYHALTAKWYVCNIFPGGDIGFYPNCGRAKIMNLWHGIPYKCIGRRQRGRENVAGTGTSKGFFLLRIYYYLIRALYLFIFPERMYTSVSSEKMGYIMCDSWPRNFKADTILRAGLARNDIMVKSKSDRSINEEMKRKMSEKFGWPLDKKWYLYLPTWRGSEYPFSFTKKSLSTSLSEILMKNNAIIIEKQHNYVLNNILSKVESKNGNIIVISKEQSDSLDTQELLLAADRLISDYSSCFFDYELSGRPVIHYVYDLEDYEKSLAGVNYDLREIAAGPIVKNETELLECLAKDDAQLMREHGIKADEPIVAEKGVACQHIANFMGLK